MLRLTAILTLIALPALAQNPGSGTAQVSWQTDGALGVELTLTLPTGCHDAGAPELAAPAGQAEIAYAAVLTIPITVQEGPCPQELKEVRVRAAIPAIPKDAVAVIIYEKWPGGAGGPEIRAHAHALPPR